MNNIQLLKTRGIVPYPFTLVRDILMDTEGMDKWDETFSKHKIIEESPEINGITRKIEYLYIKFPMMMDDRDIVLEKKIWKEYNGNKNCFLSLSKSIEHPNVPVNKKIIRAEMIMSGIYLSENKQGETNIYLINNVDLKVKTGSGIVNSRAKKSPKTFMENLIKYCKKLSN